MAYWNQTKESLLGIPRDTIALYGVVSKEIVRMMAESVRNVTDTHYGIATTGIAGPSGGTPELPGVGMDCRQLAHTYRIAAGLHKRKPR